MINTTNSTPLQTLDSDPKQTTQHREKSRLARTGPGTGNPYETNESPRTPEETTPLFLGERIVSSPHAGAGKVPASRSRSTRSPITAADSPSALSGSWEPFLLPGCVAGPVARLEEATSQRPTTRGRTGNPRKCTRIHAFDL